MFLRVYIHCCHTTNLKTSLGRFKGFKNIMFLQLPQIKELVQWLNNLLVTFDRSDIVRSLSQVRGEEPAGRSLHACLGLRPARPRQRREHVRAPEHRAHTLHRRHVQGHVRQLSQLLRETIVRLDHRVARFLPGPVLEPFRDQLRTFEEFSQPSVLNHNN